MSSVTANFDHVAISCWSVREAVPLFVDVMGGEFIRGGDDEELGIRTVQIKLPPGIKIELLQPLGEDSYLHRYLVKHGPGFHHVTLLFDDVTEAIAELEASGFEVVDTNLEDPVWRETFVRPSSGFGTLLQLVDSTFDWLSKEEGITLDDVLDGRVLWDGARVRLKDGMRSSGDVE